MKCPIKKLESECIQEECPFYRYGPNLCGLDLAAEAIEHIAQELSIFNIKFDSMF